MGFDFNKGLFDAFGAGSGFQSLTTTKATATGSHAAQLKLRLAKYLPVDGQPIDPTMPNSAKVQNCMDALDNYGQGAGVLNAHVQERLENLLDDMNVASTVKQIDSYLDDVPESCANINTIAGTMAGATDALLDASSDALDELDQGITDFDNGDMELAPFEDLLDRIADELNSSVTGILGMVSNEAKKINDMYAQFKQLAKSFSVAALIDDPCVRPFIVALAGPQLSQVLVDDFGVDDVTNL